ncbi:probable carboxylesterase 16 [Cynara cardunculus var. scolymus]|uniref:Alpha/beta hydrolase fold-3 n=1 Tax=Cynara cardunculus var. scolymus TaxID=59895 RepID=A0A103YHJ9_CYNCS|nr:probable carboxylesterase 16 [Cynara cardunculus var. scolymus]KVI09219.1 Alpha/beta hydrolase fold-3 [Cynara cardunculus var. scolymus]
MPSVAVKLYSVFFKLILKRRLQNRIQNPNLNDENSSFGVTSRPEESIAAANPSFTDGVATKDIHIETSTSLALRIFLPETCLVSTDPHSKARVTAKRPGSQRDSTPTNSSCGIPRRNSYGSAEAAAAALSPINRRNSYGNGLSTDDISLKLENGVYGGYSPFTRRCRKLPVMVQFHGGGFVAGSCDSVANDFFCRQIAKVCDVIVLAVGYRLAPENKYPAAFEDGMKALHWLAKQVNLAECSKSSGRTPESKKSDSQGQIMDAFGASLVEPWLAAHGDPSRCVLLGVSCGANIADYVARKSVEAGKLLDPVKVVAQVLMYPFFIGNTPTHSEIKLSNSYFFDRAMCILAWRLFLPEEEFSLDHPAANPLIPNRGGPPLKNMPPTLTIVAEHDWMRDRAIAYSQELKKVNVDAPVLDYKDCVHEFATLDMLLRTPEAQACADDISIWVKKYISLRGHEFSY